MRNILITLCIVFFLGMNGIAQTTIYSTGFENDTVNGGIAAQAGSPWTTWSGTVGGSEDPKVSADTAANGMHSVKVITNNDLVLDLEDKTSGRYQIKFNLFVTSGHVAYINLLQDFAGSNSAWATQTFFNVDGTCVTDANGGGAGQTTFAHDTWFEVNYIVDLDDDFATLYIDSSEVVSWKFSLGSFGDGTLLKLDALNIYGWSDDNGNGSLFYIDDVMLVEQIAPEGPTSLVATNNVNDVLLEWSAPSVAPDGYAVISNGNVIANQLIDTFYNDNELYPFTYSYQIRAHMDGLGYSAPSNTEEVTIAGGIDRNLVLLEINTGTWCGYCPGAAMGADDMEAAGYNVAIIEYHNGDPYANDDCETREDYYAVSGFPTSTFDGLAGFSGGNATQSLFDSYEILYNNRKDYPSVHMLDLVVTQVNDSTFEAGITIEETNPYFANGLVLRTAFTESHIEETWGGGGIMEELNFVCHKMYPDANGIPLDFNSNSTITETIQFDPGDAVIGNCEFVVFVQHDPSKEVVQTARVHLVSSHLNESSLDSKVKVFPNPGNGYFFVDVVNDKAKDITIEVIDMNGKLLQKHEIKNALMLSKSVDLTEFSPGSYFIKVSDGQQLISKKIIKTN